MLALDVQRQVPLAPLHTFACDTQANTVLTLTQIDQLADLTAYLAKLPEPIWVLGSGSNVVFAQDFPGTLILNRLKGHTCIEHDKVAGTATWRVAAGENWHQWVKSSIADGWCGLENLALIPGTVGAAPIQNIGAYGVELSQLCVGLSAWHLHTGEMRYFTAQDCGFAYRDSFFKQPEQLHHWVIVSVDFCLSRAFQPRTSYPALMSYAEHLTSAQAVFDAVCKIRQSKLPDPAIQPNSGSFFKNPIVSSAKAEALKTILPNLPLYPAEAFGAGGRPTKVKLSAGYLIEQAGLKGKHWADVGVSAQHALVLVRHQSGDGRGLLALAAHIQNVVHERFGVHLEPEPLLWPGI